MKILLINPPSCPGTLVNRDVMGGFGTLQGRDTLHSPMPPLKLAYVAAILERGGFTVKIQDSVLDADTQEAASCKAQAFGPDAVGMETSLETFDFDLATASLIKKRVNTPIFILGAFTSNEPARALKNPDISFVVREEPEETALELAGYLRAGKTDYSGIKGLSYRKGVDICHNPNRPFLEELSRLPHPARHLLENDRYICDKGKPGVTILGSRGCPISCPYCAYASVQGAKWRCRKPQDVVDEIRDVHNRYGIKFFQFRDAIFTFNKDWAGDICALLIKEGLGRKVSWICETAVKYLDEELLKVMKQAGCRHIGIGVETADEELQKRYARNKIISNAHALEVFRACRRLRISTCAFFMLGFPEETAESIQRSIALAKKLNSNEIQFTVVTAYPGTAIDQMLKNKTRLLSLEEVSRFRKSAYMQFYARPSKILCELLRPAVFGRKLKQGIRILRGKK